MPTTQPRTRAYNLKAGQAITRLGAPEGKTVVAPTQYQIVDVVNHPRTITTDQTGINVNDLTTLHLAIVGDRSGTRYQEVVARDAQIITA